VVLRPKARVLLPSIPGQEPALGLTPDVATPNYSGLSKRCARGLRPSTAAKDATPAALPAAKGPPMGMPLTALPALGNLAALGAQAVAAIPALAVPTARRLPDRHGTDGSNGPRQLLSPEQWPYERGLLNQT
jgi:hypothetical protein